MNEEVSLGQLGVVGVVGVIWRLVVVSILRFSLGCLLSLFMFVCFAYLSVVCGFYGSAVTLERILAFLGMEWGLVMVALRVSKVFRVHQGRSPKRGLKGMMSERNAS